jgi:membrane protein required for colicin V production
MNNLDIALCIPLLWGTYKGFTRGFIFEVAIFIALLLGVYGGFRFSGWAAVYLQQYFSISSQLLPFISFLVVFIGILVLILLLAKLLEDMIKMTGLGIVNRLSGAALGMLKWAFIMSVLFYIITPIDNKNHILSEKIKSESFLYKPISSFSMLAVPAFKNFYEKYKGEVEEKLKDVR